MVFVVFHHVLPILNVGYDGDNNGLCVVHAISSAFIFNLFSVLLNKEKSGQLVTWFVYELVLCFFNNVFWDCSESEIVGW